MRRAIAATAARSKREIPHFYLRTTVDMGPALAWLARLNEARSVERRLLPGVLLLRAVALAARAAPELNAHWQGASAPPLPDVNVGIALALRGGGLVAPAIAHADRLALDELMAAVQDVAHRARVGGLRSSEMTSATLSLTSLGDRGVESVTPVIFPPQVAMVGAGRVVERPWVVGGAVVPRPVVEVTLAVDHRASDGHQASRYLTALAERLAAPEGLA